ncbi:beta-N-acetylglucosaminidase domain-containing protein [Alphaproteobacteria bacterium LSUCC0684]
MINSIPDKTSAPHRGYIEGYYGRLLTWDERGQILETLARLGMNTYLYAPKEDPCHRRNWRQPWDRTWQEEFSRFAAGAETLGLHLMAGIAPGLDFDFGSFTGSGDDLIVLCRKARMLKDLGAASIMLLMDDIDAGFPGRSGHFRKEGEAHAALANALSESLGEAVSLTPRIYADEILDKAEGYLEEMISTLDPLHLITWCGTYIVDPEPGLEHTGLGRLGTAPERVIWWDNLYAHDYCPRQLWLGPWRGRGEIRQILLNPTGLPHTDMLLLALMERGPDQAGWTRALQDHGVPEAFLKVAPFFDLPPDPRAPLPGTMLDLRLIPTWLEALDELLWRWKTPLAREWYPFLMALRGDLLRLDGRMDELRVRKTYPPALNALTGKPERPA